jgi:branched-chain amino acid transport system ATP-binding protein
LLKLEGVSAGYGSLQILHDLSLEVRSGEVVALVGANGAGKTTTLRTISGLLRPSSGRVTFDGQDLAGVGAHEVVRRGLVMVPEGRELFGDLTVRENLDMGGFTRSQGERAGTLEQVYELFPILAERRAQRAGTMSGGQQQMLAIGRALMARPQLLMLDEPSLGLAPLMVKTVFEIVGRIRETGITVLIVEQNAVRTLELADRAYVLESGSVTVSGAGLELLADKRVRSAYLGL